LYNVAMNSQSCLLIRIARGRNRQRHLGGKFSSIYYIVVHGCLRMLNDETIDLRLKIDNCSVCKLAQGF
jgi:hypothetical protein